MVSLTKGLAFALAGLAIIWAALGTPALAETEPPGDATRGAYLFAATGCAGCHTLKKEGEKKGGPLLAGGRALKTDFGIFYTPNITPDPETGIGRWSDQDFMRALSQGVAPDGRHYFPAFPYTSYTGMSTTDMRDLKAYIFSLPAVTQTNRDHDLKWPFGYRALIGVWKALYFTPGGGDKKDRGAYLVETLGHCAECHTPRDLLGGPEQSKPLAGTRTGPEGGLVPNITPDRKTGIGTWSPGEIETFLTMGMRPDGDFAGKGMGEVISNTTSKLTKADLGALMAYLRGLAPVIHRVRADRKPSAGGEGDW